MTIVGSFVFITDFGNIFIATFLAKFFHIYTFETNQDALVVEIQRFAFVKESQNKLSNICFYNIFYIFHLIFMQKVGYS